MITYIKTDWPELTFKEVNKIDIENPAVRIMYRGLIAVLFIPEAIIKAFYEVLRFNKQT